MKITVFFAAMDIIEKQNGIKFININKIDAHLVEIELNSDHLISELILADSIYRRLNGIRPRVLFIDNRFNK